MKFDEKKLQELEDKHGVIYVLEYEDVSCVIRSPLDDMRVMRQAASAFMKSQLPADFVAAVLNNCFLIGDEKIKTEERYINGLAEEVEEIAKIPDVEITELNESVLLEFEGISAQFRYATRLDEKKAEKENRKKQPFKTEENLLEICCLNTEEWMKVKQKDYYLVAFCGSGADALKKTASVYVKQRGKRK